MAVVCGLLRGAMQVISKYLTVLREETTSAMQKQGGSRRLAALIATAGDGRDNLFSFLFFCSQYFSQYLVLTRQMTLTPPKQKLHSKSRETEKAQTFALWWKISGFDSQKKLDKLGREQLQFPPCVVLLLRPPSLLPQFRRPSMTQFGAAREGGSDGGREAGMF